MNFTPGRDNMAGTHCTEVFSSWGVKTVSFVCLLRNLTQFASEGRPINQPIKTFFASARVLMSNIDIKDVEKDV